MKTQTKTSIYEFIISQIAFRTKNENKTLPIIHETMLALWRK